MGARSVGWEAARRVPEARGARVRVRFAVLTCAPVLLAMLRDAVGALRAALVRALTEPEDVLRTAVAPGRVETLAEAFRLVA